MKLMIEAKTLGEALDIAEANLVEACDNEENLILKTGQATVTCVREWGALTGFLHLQMPTELAGVVTEEGVKKATDEILVCTGGSLIGTYKVEEIARRALKAAGVRVVQETIEGVYHCEDAYGTDRIETESRPYFLDISPEYDGKRIAVHIEVLED